MEADLYSTSSSATISAAPLSSTSCPSTSGSAPHLTTRLLPRSSKLPRSAPRLPSNPAKPPLSPCAWASHLSLHRVVCTSCIQPAQHLYAQLCRRT